MGISEYLRQIGVKNAAPGRSKLFCPECGKRTLSIKKNDEVATCFHPDHNKNFFHPDMNKDDPTECSRRLLTALHKDSMREFKLQEVVSRRKTRIDTTSLKYVTENRKIPAVAVMDAEVGIVPARTNFEIMASEFLGHLIPKNQDANEFFRKFKALSGLSGWLLFPYFDEFGNIVGLKFRNPHKKEFRSIYLKDGRHGLFFSKPIKKENPREIRLMIVEGEFDALSLQTFSGLKATLRVASLGSASSPDWEVIEKFRPLPIFLPDNDDAGKAVLEEAKLRMNLLVVSVPMPCKDIDEFVQSIPPSDQQKTLKELFSKAEKSFMPSCTVKQKCNEIRISKLPSVIKSQQLREFIWGEMCVRGKFYIDIETEQAFYWQSEIRQLAPIRSQLMQSVLGDWGLVQGEAHFTETMSHTHNMAAQTARKRKIYRFVHYDSSKNIIYVYTGSRILKISSNFIGYIENGEENIMFESGFSLGMEPELGKQYTDDFLMESLFGDILFDEDILSAEEQQALLSTWFFSLFFPSIFPTRPLLFFVGVANSGKSFAPRRLGLYLFGPEFQVTPLSGKVDDFDATVSNNFYVVYDNADQVNSDWLSDRLCCLATGAQISKRTLYTTNDNSRIRLTSSVAFTTREPQQFWHRDDVASRMLCINLAERTGLPPQPEGVLIEDISQKRPEVLSALTVFLQKICQHLEKNKDLKPQARYRISDFSCFMEKIQILIAPNLNLVNLFEKMNRQMHRAVLESKPLFFILEKWLEIPKNSGRYISAFELLKEFRDINNYHDFRLNLPQSPNSLGQTLSNCLSEINSFYDFRVMKKGGNKKYYVFWKSGPLEDRQRQECSNSNVINFATKKVV